MNIEELIKEKCPNGVIWNKLREITTWDKRFTGVDKSMQPNVVKFSHVSAADLKNMDLGEGDVKLLSTGKNEGFTNEETAGDNLNEGEVLSVPSGGTANIKYHNGKFVDSGNILCISNDNSLYNLKFIYYYLTNNISSIQNLYRGAGIQHPSMKDVLKIKVPLPPIEIQNEIVNILDKFTELEAELEAELEDRKSQYEYYRDKLLSFEKSAERLENFEWKCLGNICDLLTGVPFDSSKFTQDGIKLLRGMNVKRGYLDFEEKNNKYWDTSDGLEKYLLNKDDIIIAMDGSLVGKSYGIVSGSQLPLLLVQRVTRIRMKNDDIDGHYIYQYIISGKFTEYVESKKTGGAVPHISLKDIANFKIPIPSLEEQKRIAGILDRFNTLVNDITEGLPAEIEMRHKQYEYYRDKLLTFN